MRGISLIAALVILFILPLLTGTRAYGQISPTDRETLKGLSGVQLQLNIEGINDPYGLLGLSIETLQSDIETKLRSAGIRVLSSAEVSDSPGAPTLFVQVKAVKAVDEAAGVAIELHQDVRLQRNGERVFRAITWHDWFVVSYPTAELIRTRIEMRLDEFLNAWHSVNPKN